MRMDKEQLESKIIDYLDGKGSEAERAAVERELAENKTAYALYEQLCEVIHIIDKAVELEPSSKLKANFNNMIQAEMAEQQNPRRVFFTPTMYRAAAAIVFVMLGVGLGFWINRNQERERELAELKKQVEDNRRMMLAMLGNQQSASQRITGVSVAYEMEKADDQIVNALVKTLNQDTNTNVRLAALEALGKFSSETTVRQSLIESLATQKDPVVQIALIRLLVKMKEKGVVNQLERITKEAATMKAVKDEAHSGILKLS
jgi:uncharacterized protein YneF (UPF0154 family)